MIGKIDDKEKKQEITMAKEVVIDDALEKTTETEEVEVNSEDKTE